MQRQKKHPHAVGVARRGQPRIGVMTREHGEPVMRYYASEEEADAAITDAAVQRGLDLAGAWRDLAGEDMEAELDRSRHANPPSKPLDL